MKVKVLLLLLSTLVISIGIFYRLTEGSAGLFAVLSIPASLIFILSLQDVLRLYKEK